MSIMKLRFFAIALVASIAAVWLAIPAPAFAIKGDHARFNTCKSLKAAGKVKWYGIATGTEEDVFAVNARSRSFHVRACFSSKKACQTWVKRIWWEIPTMDELRNAWCKKV